MKLTELTIGDWVRFPNNDILDQVICINGLRNEIDGVLCSHNYCNVADLQPIPLTAEILEKNGFVKIHNKGTGAIEETFDYITNGLCVREFVEDWKDHYFVIRDTIISFKHVHELQHALRLCGLNDFASNFKI